MRLTTAMILAAGRGERMRPLTDHCPKPLLKVRGKALIESHIEALQKAGIQRLVINHAWLGEQFPACLGDGSRYGLDILYSPEQTALETAGGIINAMPLLCKDVAMEYFAVVNGDIFSDFDFSQLPKQLGNDLAHLVMVENPPHNPRGDFSFAHGRLQQGDTDKLTFSGIAVYHKTFFSGLKSGTLALAPLLRNFIGKNKVSAQQHQGSWCDVGTPERLAMLNQQEEN
jgi:N-acetyl-alpha-D-muramate 1-phosphate uridylyltransferase